jgi:hypothetical protein
VILPAALASFDGVVLTALKETEQALEAASKAVAYSHTKPRRIHHAPSNAAVYADTCIII